MSNWEIWKLRLKTLNSNPPWLIIVTRFLAALGVAWLLLEIISWAFPQLIDENIRPEAIGVASMLGFCFALIKAIPPTQFSKAFVGKSTKIELLVGDILNPTNNFNLGVLSSNYFDSCISTAISAKSLKGQLIKRFFQGNVGPFDAAVDASLIVQELTGTYNPNKKRGSNRTHYYPIGSVATVSLSQRTAFLVVASTIDINTTKTETDAQALWTSLLALWKAASTQGSREPVAIPIWGANLGNAPGNRLVLFQTILCSYAAACASENLSPTKHLKIIVWKGDYDPIEFRQMADWLNSFEL